jgi:hypothetical protein
MDAKRKKESIFKSIGFFIGITVILIGAGILAGQMFLEDLTGPTIMFIFALAFFNLYFWYRKNWWAILPGGLFLSGGTAAALDILLPTSLISGPAFLFLLATAFFLVAIVSSKNWWAILPGGTFLSIGVVVLLENFTAHAEFPAFSNHLKLGVFTWVLLLGLGLTFGMVWLLHRYQPTSWAKYPAAGLLAAAALAGFLGSRFAEIWWSALLLVGGVMILLSLLAKKKQPQTS